MRWHVQVLGRLRATNGERELTRFRTTKAAALFAYLACHPYEPHARETLIDWLWPDSTLDAGRNGLSTALSHLRHPLELPGIAPGTVLRADRAAIQLNPDAIQTDIGDFKAALHKADKARSAEARIEALTSALALYEGELLPGFYDDWVMQERQHLAALVERAATQLVTHFKAARQPDAAIEYARRLTLVDPSNEAAHRELMQLYAAQGQNAAALRQYRLLEQHLARLLDARPSAASRALARALEAQEGEQGRGSEREAEGVAPSDRLSNLPPDRPRPLRNDRDTEVTAPPVPPDSGGRFALLVTDIERSTPAWIAQGDLYTAVLTRHHALLRETFRRHGGREVREAGDGFVVVFDSVADALTCGVAAQRALNGADWPTGATPPPVRMALDVGQVQWEGGDLRGLALHHAARLAEAAHGGQILCSQSAAAMATNTRGIDSGASSGNRSGNHSGINSETHSEVYSGIASDVSLQSVPLQGISLEEVGVYRLRDFPDAQRLFQARWPDMPRADFPPPNALRGHADLLPASATRFVGRERELARLQALLSIPMSSTADCSPFSSTSSTSTFSTTSALASSSSSALPPLLPSLLPSSLPYSSPSSLIPEGTADKTNADKADAAQTGSATGEEAAPACRLITLTGLGGVGKTRLALQAAHRFVQPLEGAVYYIPLVDVTDARGMDNALRQHLGLPLAANADLRHQASELLNRRPSLLVLDNFEQLLPRPNNAGVSQADDNADRDGDDDAARAGGTAHADNGAVSLVHDLLARVPTLTILITSRHLLRLPSEREFSVPPLQTPPVGSQSGSSVSPLIGSANSPLTASTTGFIADAAVPSSVAPSEPEAMLRQLNACESVRLFVDRAQDARPDFQLTIKNAPAIAELCARLEGLPLALELAAARAQILTPAQMLAQLQDRFAFLVSRQRGLTPRQRSLRGALDWSFALLTPDIGRFLTRLSVFRGGWTWEAAESVCGGSGEENQRKGVEISLAEGLSPLPASFDVLDYLAELRDCSLALAYDSEEHRRFRLLETLREYADEQLSPIEREGLRQAHYAYYLDMAERSEPALNGPDQAEWLNRLESEHDNLRAALRGANDVEARLRLAGALYHFWERRDHFQEGRYWLETAGVDGGVSPSVWAKALNGAGVLALSQGDHGAAQRHLEQSLELQRQMGDTRGEAIVLNNLGNLRREQGQYAAAQTAHEHALRLWEDGAQDATAWSYAGVMLSNLGLVALYAGDLAQAQARFEAGLQKCRQSGNQMQAARTLSNLGIVAKSQQRHEQAQVYYEESLTMFRGLGANGKAAIVLLNLGGIVYEREGGAAAWPLLVESLRLRQEAQDRAGIPIGLVAAAQVVKEQSQWEEAATIMGAAEVLRESDGVPLPPSESEDYAEDVAIIRNTMGAKAFKAAWEQGRQMTMPQVILYVSTFAGF